eukprot:CAMPEP_0114359640 /NCGR_PEP_ID=MMETSP0101-20121206/23176_1 /TAXON_ID=38822 ORGANISM="Pteridomonas danica, Strain PT" /NCGR_SAMPLE_ID=MMETSP0101 /ASSEMBLY_ACC=CAM_ASM_000211 /LENGTH=411 /DNA_ID=CAMNT_0001503299 /DNA_START=32 /DNA_END=1267 /DNA_ORIENTATION=+
MASKKFSGKTPTAVALSSRLSETLGEIETAGTFKHERVITTAQNAEVKVEGSDAPVMNFCANNYLGLSSHPRVVGAAKDALDTHGFGLSSVRFICGTQDIHKQLEADIAKFHETEDCILYPSCFDANAGLFEVLLSKADTVISDSLNHASIIDGVRLCKAKRLRYEHMDLVDLERCLKESVGNTIVATDGVFSMDGDVAPLKEILEMCEAYGATLFIDECHASGFFGETGRGTMEHCGVQDRVGECGVIINSTLGKALGGATGGYTAGPKEVVGLLRQRSRPYLFSNSLAPSVAGASIEVFKMLTESSSLVDKVQENTRRFRERMTAAGFDLRGDPTHPICPIMLGDARLAQDFSSDMLAKNIYVIGFSYPVVPLGKARIRVQISASHSLAQVDEAIDAFIEVGKARGVIA